MRTKLFILLSIPSYKEKFGIKTDRPEKPLLTLVEEIGAWLLFGGFLIGCSYIARVLFGS